MNFLKLRADAKAKFERWNISALCEVRAGDELVACLGVAVPFPTLVILNVFRIFFPRKGVTQ